MLIWDNSPLPKATMCELLIPVQRLELGIMWIRRKQGNQNAFEHTGECARCKLSIKGKIWEEAGTSAPNSLLLIETPWANFEQVHQGKEIPTSYNSPVNANWRGDLGYENQRICVTSSITSTYHETHQSWEHAHKDFVISRHLHTHRTVWIAIFYGRKSIEKNLLILHLILCCKIETPWGFAWHKMEQVDRGERYPYLKGDVEYYINLAC